MRSIQVFNLTPHAINYIPDESMSILYDPEPEPARVSVRQEKLPYYDGLHLRIVHEVYGEVTGLPEPEEGVYYIVSLLVQQQCPDRRDLLSPTDFIRNDTGEIVGCRAFRVNF